ncbi:hypothetical protein ACFCZT_12835 [Streptomyces sp. NPDC056230]|uniref:hypothetical protein n=1 Tax=Streptomyces sp. NPDC056230 TaxID=3345754 RepID=UPI0035D90041
MRGRAEPGAETAVQGCRADGGAGGEAVVGESGAEVLLGPGRERAEQGVGDVGQGVLDELAPAAVAMGGEDRTAAHGGRDPGAVFVVSRGTWHKPSASGDASALLFEPSGTPPVGDRHDEEHVDATTGHAAGGGTRRWTDGADGQGLRATPA